MILGTGAMAVKAVRKFIGACTVNRGYKTIKTPVLSLALLLCLCVNSWGGCASYTFNCGYAGYCGCGQGWGSQEHCDGTPELRGCQVFNNPNCPNASPSGCGNWYGTECKMTVTVTNNTYVVTKLACDTQEEADSVFCELYPTDPSCEDACTDLRNRCEGIGGKFQGQVAGDECIASCDICQTEATLALKDYIYQECCKGGMTPQYTCLNNFAAGGYYSQIDGKCNTQNWETNKVCSDYFSSSSAEQDQSSSSTSTESSSSVSEYCMLFPDDLACICEEHPEHPDCAYLNSSSSEGSSSGSEGGEGGEGSSSSSDGEGGEGGDNSSASGGVIGGGGDWEYDYRDSLHRIINATTRTATNTKEIANNTQGIWAVLRNARCLFEDCSSDTIRYDTNATPNPDTSGWGGFLDSARGWLADSAAYRPVLGGPGAICDTTGGNKCPPVGGSLESAASSWGSTYKALGDSLTEGAVGDSLRHWESMLTNNGVITGSGSNACPSVLTRTYTITIGQVSVDVGSLGTYICANVPGTSITFWTLARVLIRALVAITCMWWLYGAVTGVSRDGGDDD